MELSIVGGALSGASGVGPSESVCVSFGTGTVVGGAAASPEFVGGADGSGIGVGVGCLLDILAASLASIALITHPTMSTSRARSSTKNGCSYRQCQKKYSLRAQEHGEPGALHMSNDVKVPSSNFGVI